MKKTLILGAGYAGMMAAARLERLDVPFTIINKHPYHYFTTLLHEAAGGRGNPANYNLPIKSLLRKDSTNLVVDSVVGIDRHKKSVATEQGEYSYDWLIFTLGNAPEYFGIPGLEQYSMVLRSLDSAVHIRQHIEDQFHQFTRDHDERHLRIVIGGAGLTGIELVGEILDWIPELCIQLGIAREKVDVQNIEAMPTILPQVTEALREVAMQTLTDKGCQIRVNTKIVEVVDGAVHLDGGDVVESGTIIWTGGVRANPLLTDAGFTVDRRGRAKVNEFLQSVDDERVFVGGDSAWCDSPDGRPYPPTAQIASQMGKQIAQNVVQLAQGRAMEAFKPSLKGTLASLGREVGVGDVGGLPVKGVVAAMAKEATKVKYLWDLGGIRLAAKKSQDLVHI